MKQVYEKGAKIQVVRADSDNWYKIGEIYTVHSYLEDEDAYVVQEQYEVYKDSAWICAKDVEQFVDWSKAPEGYDFWIVDNEGNMPSTFYKYIENHGRWGDCYVDINQSYWTATCDYITVYKRPVAEKKEVNALDNRTRIHNEYYALITEHFTQQEEQEMQDIDWSKAPEGYDFWIEDKDGDIQPALFRYVENHYSDSPAYVDENECYWAVNSPSIIVYKRPAKEQEMNNEWKHGLPPVNTEFEYSFGNDYWYKATCTYVVGDSGVVAMCETMESVVEQYLDVEDCEFRPIKSKEQQEKEDAIAEMVSIGDSQGSIPHVTHMICEALYDAGYRKVE